MLKRYTEIFLFLLNLHLALGPPPPGESLNDYPRPSTFSALTSIKNFVDASYKLLEVNSLAENISNWFGYGSQGKTSEPDLQIYTSDGNIFVEANNNEEKRKEDETIAAEFAPDCDIPLYPDYIVTPPPDTVNGHLDSDFYFEEREKISPNDDKNNIGQKNGENSKDKNNGNTDRNLETDNLEMIKQKNIEFREVEELNDNERVNMIINYEQKNYQGKQEKGPEDLIETIKEKVDVRKSTNVSDPNGKEAENSTDKNTHEFILNQKTAIISENAQYSLNNYNVSNDNDFRQKHSNGLDLEDSVQENEMNIKNDGENQGKELKEIDKSSQKENLADNSVDTNQPDGQLHSSVNDNIQKNTDEKTEKHETRLEENDYANKIELTQKFLSEERKALAREKMSDLISKSDREIEVDQTANLRDQSNKITEKEGGYSDTNNRKNNESQESIDIQENIPNDTTDNTKQIDDLSHETEILDESNLINDVVKQENTGTSKHRIVKKNLNDKSYENVSNNIKSDIKLVGDKIIKTENEINAEEKEIIDGLTNLNIDPGTIKKYLKKYRKENYLIKNKKGKENDITMIDIFEKISTMMEKNEKKKRKKKSLIREEDL